MAPRNNLQNRIVSNSSSSSSGGDGSYGFFFVEELEDREAPKQPIQVLTCENLQAYSSPIKGSLIRNISSVSTISTVSPSSSQRNSPRILEEREEKEEAPKNIVFVFENNRAPGT